MKIDKIAYVKEPVELTDWEPVPMDFSTLFPWTRSQEALDKQMGYYSTVDLSEWDIMPEEKNNE